jgi:uncharacterized protein
MEGLYLLDAWVLIALSDQYHTAHKWASEWFAANCHARFATCPITQMALFRYLLRVYPEQPFHEAKETLKLLSELPTHQFWPDNYNCLSLPENGILGQGHLTDAYLVNLAKANGGRVATLDHRMADVYSPTAFLIS